MHRYVRILLVTSCLGVILAIPASAVATDPRIPLVGSGTFSLDGYCAFPVQVSFTSNEYVIHESKAPDGTTTDQIAGYATYTVTSPSGESITYQANGPGTAVYYPNGAVKSYDLHGPNLLWTKPLDLKLFPGVPYISYTTGHVTLSVDASGKTTAYRLEGTQTDVCQALAG